MVVLLWLLTPCLFALVELNTENSEPLSHLPKIYSDEGDKSGGTVEGKGKSTITEREGRGSSAWKSGCEQRIWGDKCTATQLAAGIKISQAICP